MTRGEGLRRWLAGIRFDAVSVAFLNYLKVINGAIIQGHTIELKKKLDETDDALLQIGIAELRLRFESHSKEVIVPFQPELEDENIRFLVPQRGDKKKLLLRNKKLIVEFQEEENEETWSLEKYKKILFCRIR